MSFSLLTTSTSTHVSFSIIRTSIQNNTHSPISRSSTSFLFSVSVPRCCQCMMWTFTGPCHSRVCTHPSSSRTWTDMSYISLRVLSHRDDEYAKSSSRLSRPPQSTAAFTPRAKEECRCLDDSFFLIPLLFSSSPSSITVCMRLVLVTRLSQLHIPSVPFCQPNNSNTSLDERSAWKRFTSIPPSDSFSPDQNRLHPDANSVLN